MSFDSPKSNKKPCARDFGKIELFLLDRGGELWPRYAVQIRKRSEENAHKKEVIVTLSMSEAEGVEQWIAKVREWVKTNS